MTTRKYTRAQKRAYAIKMRGQYTNNGMQEFKFVDFETNGDAFATTWARMEDGTIQSVSGVTQGDGESNRDGRKYLIHSIHIKAKISVNASESQGAPLNDITGRVCLVWDTQTNEAAFTATDVMDGGGNDDTLSFRNLQHSKRFRVLWDKSFKIIRRNVNEGSVNLFATGNETTPIINYNKKFKKPIPVICSGTTNVITSISDNSLHIIGVASSTTALLEMQIRIRFTG